MAASESRRIRPIETFARVGVDGAEGFLFLGLGHESRQGCRRDESGRRLLRSEALGLDAGPRWMICVI
jgi:hypothetical protein